MKNEKQSETLNFALGFKAKATKDYRATIYARITIEGKDEEISLGRKVDPKFWENELKLVTENGMEAKVTNQKILQIKSDLERHFMMLQTAAWTDYKFNAQKRLSGPSCQL